MSAVFQFSRKEPVSSDEFPIRAMIGASSSAHFLTKDDGIRSSLQLVLDAERIIL